MFLFHNPIVLTPRGAPDTLWVFNVCWMTDRMNEWSFASPRRIKRFWVPEDWFNGGGRRETIPTTTVSLPILLQWHLKMYPLQLLAKATRQVNCSIIKAKFWPGQDPNKVSLENYQITSQGSEVTESTNKPSEQSQRGSLLNNTENV